MKLIVGTDSTWSLRAWICGQIAELEPEVEVVNLSGSDYKNKIVKYSQAGLVPVLQVDNFCIHDSLAIAEYFNECSEGRLYPSSEIERAQSRGLCAELHSGFIALRASFPFTLDRVYSSPAENDNIRCELDRVEDIFSKAKIPFMFDSASAVDAFYSVLAYRLQTYGVELSGKAGEYQQSLLNWSLLQQAISLASGWRNA